jgi:predicted RNase H-like nuclease (RuvC/YqgF family)
MAEVTDPHSLRAELIAVVQERDAALTANEVLTRDMEVQRRQLMEEQDRFVARLISAHEQEVTRLQKELEDAKSEVLRLERDVVMARALLEDAMSDPTPTPRLHQSVQPVSGSHATSRNTRESGIVGRGSSTDVATDPRRSRR